MLVGTAGGALVGILAYAADTVARLVGAPPPSPWWFVDLDPLLGPMMSFADILAKTVKAVGFGLGVVLLLLLLRTIARRQWLAAGILVVLLSIEPLFFATGPLWIVFPAAILIRIVPVVLTLRFGVLATIVCMYVAALFFDTPINADFWSWKATPTLMSFAVVMALAIHGFRSAIAGRPFLGERIA